MDPSDMNPSPQCRPLAPDSGVAASRNSACGYTPLGLPHGHVRRVAPSK